MCNVRDPTIKLFGKTIPVAGDGDDDDFDGSTFSDQLDIYKDGVEQESMETEQPDDALPPAKEASGDPSAIAEADENQEDPSSDKDSEKDIESPKGENDSNESKNSPQKTLKKPDKILPCPRCNSMDTKFCYYNNYNINQPRHFCKGCQRYWTAGGTMRNVPVGAGRRRNKSSVSRYCHITVSEALQAAQLDVPNGVHHPGMKPNGTVLTFGSENPFCESMASVLNLADKKKSNLNVQKSRENDDNSTASTVTTSSMDDGVKKGQDEAMKPHLNGFTTQMPCFQWPYLWNPTVSVPPFCPSSFPMPIYPTPYWNGAIPWNIPWVPPYSPGSLGLKSPGSSPSSPTLGKHSRDGELLTPSNNEKGSRPTTVLVPKTLRTDDPADAAKSSIWTTLGIKKERGDHISRGFFNNFQSKAKEKDKKMEASPALKANPAALCRSISFQESAKR